MSGVQWIKRSPINSFARYSCTALLSILLFSGCAAVSNVVAQESAPVRARTIQNFKVGSDESRFGAFEFVGGVELISENRLFGAISSIRFRPDGRQFVAVLDTGHWMTGTLQRNADGKLAGLDDVAISPMVNASGRRPTGKAVMDAEGLAFGAGEVIVSFEQRHRIDVYPDPGFETAKPSRSLALPFPVRELRFNGGMEALAVAPAGSPLAGAVVTVAENSIDGQGNLIAGILDGPQKGAFAVVRNLPYDVTDAAFLPDGDLLLLERRFNLAQGLGMRIRRIAAADIRPGAVVDGTVLLEADMGYQIDNMEGLDVIDGGEGALHVIVTSDDNHSILQRNLMLEFRLLE